MKQGKIHLKNKKTILFLVAMATILWLSTTPGSERPDKKSRLDPTKGRHFANVAKMYKKPKSLRVEISLKNLTDGHQTLSSLAYHPIEILSRKNRERIPSGDGENRKTISNFLVRDQTT